VGKVASCAGIAAAAASSNQFRTMTGVWPSGIGGTESRRAGIPGAGVDLPYLFQSDPLAFQ
jgi:hypothetical protein